MPKISVVMSTYNHAPFIKQCIDSVLNQTFQDFEFLISDDGSQDGTALVILNYTDSRIKFSSNTRNQGAYIVTNELIKMATGEYIALINSDDYWPVTKLEHQLEFLENNKDFSATFGKAIFVDKNGTPLEEALMPYEDPFKVKNYNQGKWLRNFFEKGNCLCHPTMLIRRSCYDHMGFYDNRYRLLPDFKMWINFVKLFKFHISPEKLIYYRILPGENSSSPTDDNHIRIMNEHYLIANEFFENVTREIFIEGFADLLKIPEISSTEQLDIEKALIFYHHNNNVNNNLVPVYKIVGLEKLYKLLQNDRHRIVLEKDYGIDDIYFHNLMAKINIFRPEINLS